MSLVSIRDRILFERPPLLALVHLAVWPFLKRSSSQVVLLMYASAQLRSFGHGSED